MSTTTELSAQESVGSGSSVRGPRRPTPRLILTVDDLRRAVEIHASSPMFALDVETDGLRTKTNNVLWVGLASSGRVSIIPLGHPNGNTDVPEHYIDVPIEGTSRPYLKDPTKFTKPKTRKQLVPATFHPPPQQLRPDVVFEELKPLLLPGGSSRTCIGHNLKFDLMSIAKYYGDSYLSDTTLQLADTLVLAHLLDERRREFGLKPLVGKWLIGQHAYADKRKRLAFYPELGSKILQSSLMDVARYLSRDVYYTWLLWWKNYQRLPNSLLGAFQAEMDTYRVIMAMQNQGVMVDEALLQSLHGEVEQELADIEVDAWKITGQQFSLTNNNTKRDLLFNAPKDQGGQRLKPLSFSRTGLAQVDRKTVEHYRNSNPLASCFYDHSVAQAQSKFIQQMLDNIYQGRIHCQFNQHKAETGRLSSSEPNLQNVPKDGRMRDAFIAAPGHKLIVADYDQIELRCLAFLSEDPEMIDLFQTGRDIHTEAASAMLNIPPGEVTPTQRDLGKTVNFSVGYGATAHRVSRVVGCTVEQAQGFIDRYYQRFARLQPWKIEVLSVAVDRGDRSDITRKPPYVVIPPFNRRRRVEELYDPLPKIRASGQRQAVNAVVQGFASYIMKLAMIGLHRDLTHGHLELQVHDEAIIEVEAEHAVSTLEEVVEIMQDVRFNGDPILGPVPLVASAHIGDTWKEGKGK